MWMDTKEKAWFLILESQVAGSTYGLLFISALRFSLVKNPFQNHEEWSWPFKKEGWKQSPTLFLDWNYLFVSLIKFLLVNQTFHFFLLWLLTVSLVKHIQKHASPASPSFCLSQFCLPIVLVFTWFPRGKGAVTWTLTGTCPSHSLTVAYS